MPTEPIASDNLLHKSCIIPFSDVQECSAVESILFSVGCGYGSSYEQVSVDINPYLSGVKINTRGVMEICLSVTDEDLFSDQRAYILEPEVLMSECDQESDVGINRLNALRTKLEHKKELIRLRRVLSAGSTALSVKPLSQLTDQDVRDLRAIDCLYRVRPEEYRTLRLSTAHLTEEDIAHFAYCCTEGSNIVFKHDTGYLVKFTGDLNSDLGIGHSSALQDIVGWSHKQGYSMVEFDRDTPSIDSFPDFEH